MPVRHDLICPDCGASMVLRSSTFGKFYGCSTFPKCKSAHGAHADGTPLGIPASKPTKDARIRAHEEFDKLWQAPDGLMSRSDAYAWMANALGLSSKDAHIGRFDIEQCERLILAARARRLLPPPAPVLPTPVREFWEAPEIHDASDHHEYLTRGDRVQNVDGMQDYDPGEGDGGW